VAFTHPLNWAIPARPFSLRARIPALAELPEHILLFSLVALTPIQDTILQATPLGGLGTCASLWPLLPLTLIAFVRWIGGGLRLSRTVFWCCCYMALLTAYGFVRFGLVSEGENTILKTATHMTVFVFAVLAIFVPNYEMRSTVRMGCYVAFFLCIIGILFSLGAPFGLPQIFEQSPLHYRLDDDLFRPRGFSTEPSMLSITLIAVGLLCAHFSRTKFGRRFYVLSTLGLFLVARSKGGIAVLFVCVLVLAIGRWHKWYQAPLVLVTLVPLGMLTGFWLMTMFPENGFATAGTIQVRTSTVLCALFVAANHPLGVGFSGFIPAMRVYLPPAMAAIQSLSPLPLAFEESTGYLTSARAIGTSAFFFDQLIRFGWPFAIFFAVFSLKLLKGLRHARILWVAVLASLICLCIYVSIVGQFATSVLLGVALTEARAFRNQPAPQRLDSL
jgi:hypothetical protein